MEFDKIEIDKSFKLCNGKILKNFKDLKKYIVEMPDEVYNFHVNSKGNDFAFWIKNCLNMNEVASSIAAVRKKETFIKKILEA